MKIEIVLKASIESGTITINFFNPSQLFLSQNGSITLSNITHSHARIPYYDPGMIETVETISGISEVTTTAMLGTSAATMIAGGGSGSFTQQLSIVQALFCLLFLNVQYPRNLATFLGVFKVSTLKFIPNPFSWFIENYDEETVESPAKFNSNGLDGLFLKNSGQFLFLFAILGTIHILCLLFKSINDNFFLKVSSTLEANLIVKILISSSTILLLTMFLQIFTADWNSNFKITS